LVPDGLKKLLPRAMALRERPVGPHSIGTVPVHFECHGISRRSSTYQLSRDITNKIYGV